MKVDNVAGVKIPVFEKAAEEKKTVDLTGLARGGQKLDQARVSFSKALDALIVLASLQTAFVALEEAQKVTNRRVNALEYVVIPKLEETLRYIATELDELEREVLPTPAARCPSSATVLAPRTADRAARPAPGLCAPQEGAVVQAKKDRGG